MKESHQGLMSAEISNSRPIEGHPLHDEDCESVYD
jgi:hypothetical protein